LVYYKIIVFGQSLKFSLSIDADLHKELKIKSIEEEITVTQFVRDAIEEKLNS